MEVKSDQDVADRREPIFGYPFKQLPHSCKLDVLAKVATMERFALIETCHLTRRMVLQEGLFPKQIDQLIPFCNRKLFRWLPNCGKFKEDEAICLWNMMNDETEPEDLENILEQFEGTNYLQFYDDNTDFGYIGDPKMYEFALKMIIEKCQIRCLLVMNVFIRDRSSLVKARFGAVEILMLDRILNVAGVLEALQPIRASKIVFSPYPTIPECFAANQSVKKWWKALLSSEMVQSADYLMMQAAESKARHLNHSGLFNLYLDSPIPVIHYHISDRWFLNEFLKNIHRMKPGQQRLFSFSYHDIISDAEMDKLPEQLPENIRMEKSQELAYWGRHRLTFTCRS